MVESPKGTIRKRKMIRARNAEPRVWSNNAGKVYPRPGVGEMSKLPDKFVQKNGTPIRYSLTGDKGIKRVYQRSNRIESIRRLLASICYCEAVHDLGYRNAIVWIGKQRFQPSFNDLRDAGLTKEEIRQYTGMAAPSKKRRKKRSKHEREAEKMAAKKDKKGSKSASDVMGRKEAKAFAKKSGRNYCAFLIATTKRTDKKTDKKIRKATLKFCPASATAKDKSKFKTLKKRVLAGKVAWLGKVIVHKVPEADEKPAKKGKKDKGKKGKAAKKVKGKIVKRISKKGKKGKKGKRKGKKA